MNQVCISSEHIFLDIHVHNNVLEVTWSTTAGWKKAMWIQRDHIYPTIITYNKTHKIIDRVEVVVGIAFNEHY